MLCSPQPTSRPALERHGAFISMSARICSPFRHASSTTCQSACRGSGLLRTLGVRLRLTRCPLESGATLLPAFSGQEGATGTSLRLACSHDAEANWRLVVCSNFRNRHDVPSLAITQSPSCHDIKFLNFFNLLQHIKIQRFFNLLTCI